MGREGKRERQKMTQGPCFRRGFGDLSVRRETRTKEGVKGESLGVPREESLREWPPRGHSEERNRKLEKVCPTLEAAALERRLSHVSITENTPCLCAVQLCCLLLCLGWFSFWCGWCVGLFGLALLSKECP